MHSEAGIATEGKNTKIIQRALLMMNKQNCSSKSGIKAIILMGGSGERFGNPLPKQFHLLSGKKIYLHTLEAFLSSELFDEILLVTHTESIPFVKQDLASYPDQHITLVEGGRTRQESSFRGLRACHPLTRIVVIHDAVRPFVSLNILRDNVEKTLQFHAVDTCIPSTDTLVYSPSHTHIEEIPLRSHYLRGQTPQSFSYSLILEAHKKALEEGWTDQSDDCSLIMKQGFPVHVVTGSEENIKITSEIDLFLAEQLIRLKSTSLVQPKHSSSLEGKKIAITGGSGGIGMEICKRLKQEGAIPLVISRSAPFYKADLTSFAQTQALFETLFQQHGPLDGLVNSIGLLKVSPLDSLSAHEIETQIATNLTSVIYCCKCAKLKSGGHIVNIASSSYVQGRKNYTVYASTKAALINFTQGLSEEKKGLCINALVPSRTNTPLRSSNFTDEDPSTLLDPKIVS